jgi:hypothetical protein
MSKQKATKFQKELADLLKRFEVNSLEVRFEAMYGYDKSNNEICKITESGKVYGYDC